MKLVEGGITVPPLTHSYHSCSSSSSSDGVSGLLASGERGRAVRKAGEGETDVEE